MRIRYIPHGKRVLDIVLTLGACIVLIPILVLLSAIALIAHGRPLYFRQVRIGRWGRPFILIKMRSMQQASTSSQNYFSPGGRQSITTIGRFLRAYKLDELPQFWNVLRGDMSLVGPRPEIPGWVEYEDPAWKRVLHVRPGMTDRASIKYRNEESILASVINPTEHYKEVILPDKLAIGRQYVEFASFREDLRVLSLTIFTVLYPAASKRAASPMENS